MPPKRPSTFDENTLTKGQSRKLNALRKSLGPEIADRAFAEWFDSQGTDDTEPEDKNAQLITEKLEPLAVSGELKIPRGGYVVRRGRGRVIVQRPKGD